MPLFTETWDGTAAGWPAQWSTFVAFGSGAICDRVSGRGRLATGNTAFGRAGGLPVTPLTSTDYELTLDIGPLPIFSEWYFYVHVRGSGYANYHRMGDAYQIRMTCTSGGPSIELWETNSAATSVSGPRWRHRGVARVG